MKLNRILLESVSLIFVILSYAYSSIVFADANHNSDEQKSNTPSTVQSTNANSGFIFYGNWCGPNHPADITTAAPPIDLLDAQCKAHDLCYVNKGEFDCGCDRVLVTGLDQNQKKHMFTSEQYLLAQNIKLHFAFSPCNGVVDGNKVLPTRVLTRLYKGTKNRVLNTYDRLLGDRFSGMQRNKDTANNSANADQSITNNE